MGNSLEAGGERLCRIHVVCFIIAKVYTACLLASATNLIQVALLIYDIILAYYTLQYAQTKHLSDTHTLVPKASSDLAARYI